MSAEEEIRKLYNKKEVAYHRYAYQEEEKEFIPVERKKRCFRNAQAKLRDICYAQAKLRDMEEKTTFSHLKTRIDKDNMPQLIHLENALRELPESFSPKEAIEVLEKEINSIDKAGDIINAKRRREYLDAKKEFEDAMENRKRT